MSRLPWRWILSGIGVTDRTDQAAILDAIRLDGIEVDERGEVDADELEQRITNLRRILGAPAPKRRIPPADTRDKGGRDAKPVSRDQARYQRFIQGGA